MEKKITWRLGLDIGTNSIGWAALSLADDLAGVVAGPEDLSVSKDYLQAGCETR